MGCNGRLSHCDSAYAQNAIGPNCMPEMWFFDIFLTLFFLAGSAMPCALVAGFIRTRRLMNALKSHGVQKVGQVIGKRQYVTRSKNSSTTHYMVMLQYQTDYTGMQVAQKEFSVTGAQYSVAQEHVTTIQVVHLPDEPLQAYLATALEGNNSGIAAFMGMFFIFFFGIWNGFLLFLSPWCYAPVWAYPIGAFCGCKVCGNQGEGSGQILSASEMATQQTQQQAAKTPLVGYSDFNANPNIITAIPVQPATAGGGVSIADEIMKLQGLRDQGILSEMEFQTAKQRALNGGGMV